MEKNQLISNLSFEERSKMQKSKAAKIEIYAKKLSSSSKSNRKKALFRLLELDPSILKSFSEKKGCFHIEDNWLFLAGPEQIKKLKNYLNSMENMKQHIKIDDQSHANYFEFDDIGFIQHHVSKLGKNYWRYLVDNENYKKLPDPRMNIFWISLLRKKDQKEVLQQNLKISKKIKSITFGNLENMNNIQQRRKGNKFRISRSRNKKNGKKTCKIFSFNKKFLTLNERPDSEIGSNFAPKTIPKHRILGVLDSLDKRTDSQFSKSNNSPKFLTPDDRRRRPAFSTKKKFSISSKFKISAHNNKPERSQGIRSRNSSMGKFERAVILFRKRRELAEKYDRARSFEKKLRTIESRKMSML